MNAYLMGLVFTALFLAPGVVSDLLDPEDDPRWALVAGYLVAVVGWPWFVAVAGWRACQKLGAWLRARRAGRMD